MTTTTRRPTTTTTQPDCSCVARHTRECIGGLCYCELGYTGSHCENQCQQGTYGDNCANTCSCVSENSNGCDHQYGDCDCKDGYTGIDCEIAEEMPRPVLTINPNKDVFATNDTFTLICTPSDPVYSFVTFYHDNWKVSRQSTELVVQDVNPDYTGNYTCTVQYSGTGPSPKSNIVSLVVEEPTNKMTTTTRRPTTTTTQPGCSCVARHTRECIGGLCYCELGYTGRHCESQCQQGTYGADCVNTCSCVRENTNECDFQWGDCYCKDGYTGIDCETQITTTTTTTSKPTTTTTTTTTTKPTTTTTTKPTTIPTTIPTTTTTSTTTTTKPDQCQE